MMESFLVDAENSLHHRTSASQNYGPGSSGEESDDPMDDPFLYDKFLPDPAWEKAKKAEEEEEEARPKVLIDPGLFRYNQRVFVTSLPAVMLVLALGGETLVLLGAVGMTAVAVVSQLGDSRRCVIAFVLIFIPSHMYVIASVLPLLWLSLWHFLLLVLVNLFMVLTAAWIMLQFKSFRQEEPFMCSVIEQLLFTVYPFASTALTCWGLGGVLPVNVVPTVFLLFWFVLLQLYLVPALSSFRKQTTPDENLDVVQLPICAINVLLFVVVAPFLHIFLSLVVPSAEPLSLMTLVHFVFILSLTLFLSTLLSIRQIFEQYGLPYSSTTYVRWSSGVLCTVISYPVLRAYGFDSHFLPLLPVAIAIFAILGVVLAFKKRQVIMAGLAFVLVTSLVALFVLWIQRMPHSLQYYLMGYMPLNGFYLVMCVHFLLCLLCLWTSSMDGTNLFGCLLILQALALSVCEISLHNSGLYSTTLLQLSGVTATYTTHRLQLAGKVTRTAATLATTVHMAKTISSATALVLNSSGGMSSEATGGQVTFYALLSLACITYAVTSVFVYGGAAETDAEKDVPTMQVVKHMAVLLLSLAVTSFHLLLPLAVLMFQGSKSYTNVIGLWCMLGGGLLLLYHQAVGGGKKEHVLKLALGLASMGVVVILVHPRLALSFWSVFQWFEMVSLFVLGGVLSSQPKISPTRTVTALLGLAVCPGIRASLFLWHELLLPQASLCVAISASLLILISVCVFIKEMNATSDKIIKYSVIVSLLSCAGLLGLDLAYMMSLPSNSAVKVTLWTLPAWQAILVTGLALAVTLKLALAAKGPDKLPICSETDSAVERLTLPFVTNCITILTFCVACCQGPADPVLHDLWCCASSTVLACVHKDSVMIHTSTGGDRQVAPTIAASGLVLTVATTLRSRMWWAYAKLGFWSTLGGVCEVVIVLMLAPIFYCMWALLWRNEVVSEPVVVFLTPYSVLLVLLASCYTAWVLAVAALVAGVWMMLYRLPMVPYSIDPSYYDN